MTEAKDRSRASRAFNARWLSPAEVAENFVPVPAFEELVSTHHAVLLGPRGSGKTTLLKMLTRRALNTWSTLLEEDPEPAANLALPSFEAVYLPSDVRWSIELSALSDDPAVGSEPAVLLQRFLVTASSIQAVARTLSLLCSKDDRLLESEVVKEFVVNNWSLRAPAPATLTQLSTAVTVASNQIRGVVNRRNADDIATLVSRLPKDWTSGALDVPILLCDIFNRHAGHKVRGERWAFCFDELEIAPPWLRQELLVSLRSVTQPYLLKLTGTPVFPLEALGSAARDHDFKQIMLWHGRAHDARPFACQLASRFVRDHFGPDATPKGIFGHSSVHEEADEESTSSAKYDRDSREYKDFVKLAKRDDSFAQLLHEKGLDPSDPFTKNTRLKDSLLRKIRPLVVLRLAFLGKDNRLRSRRKVPELYSGIEVLYDVCEGNPRWLLGLISDLNNPCRKGSRRSEVVVSPQAQAEILLSFARRFHDELTARTVRQSGEEEERHRWTLGDLVGNVAKALSNRLLFSPFSLDPVGTFRMDQGQPPQIEKLVEAGLDAGAFIYVGGRKQVTPNKLEGSRLRLSYRLAPLYRLPLRSYRDVILTSLLEQRDDLDLFSLLDKDPT
ncbi:MAG: hypothetical protein J4F34_08930 [Gemmatimonadetes bacterium]|nr:hypothetical protein [Gemmatimonadota bacterium]